MGMDKNLILVRCPDGRNGSTVTFYSSTNVRHVKHQIRLENCLLDSYSREFIYELYMLSLTTGMPINQINGQRHYGPPSYYLGPPPQRDTEVYIWKIPREVMETELVPIVSRAGQIYQMRLMMSFSGLNRGYCYVQYMTKDEALRAVSTLNDHEIRSGKHLKFQISNNNCCLYLKGLPQNKNSDELCKELEKIAPGVISVKLLQPKIGSGLRGHAIVHYQDNRMATIALRMLQSELNSSEKICVQWARSIKK